MKTKTYPEIGFLRLRDVIGDKNNPGIILVSRSSYVRISTPATLNRSAEYIPV